MYEISNQMKNEESNVIIDSPLARLFKFVILVIPLYPKLRKLCRKNSKRLYESTLGPKLLKNVEKKNGYVSSSRDLGGNRMVTMGSYERLIKEKIK